MSALPPKADMCGNRDVRFVPIADIGQVYSITSSASAMSAGGTLSARQRSTINFRCYSHIRLQPFSVA